MQPTGTATLTILLRHLRQARRVHDETLARTLAGALKHQVKAERALRVARIRSDN